MSAEHIPGIAIGLLALAGTVLTAINQFKSLTKRDAKDEPVKTGDYDKDRNQLLEDVGRLEERIGKVEEALTKREAEDRTRYETLLKEFGKLHADMATIVARLDGLVRAQERHPR